jgi:hypothetical protein
MARHEKRKKSIFLILNTREIKKVGSTKDIRLQAVKASISSEQHLNYLRRLCQQSIVESFSRKHAAGIIQKAWRTLLLARKEKKKKSKKAKSKSAADVSKKQTALLPEKQKAVSPAEKNAKK